jgi:hypothetical protein
MNEAVVIGYHPIEREPFTDAVLVRLWTGEELYCHKHLVDGRVPLQVGDVIEDLKMEYEFRLTGGRLKATS